MLLGQRLELQGQAGLLDVEGGAVGLEFMARQEQIEQPVVGFGRLLSGDVEQEAVVQGSPADRHLGGELIANHAPLLGGLGLVAVEVLRPLAGGVVPEHHPLAGQSSVEAVLDSESGGGGGHDCGSVLLRLQPRDLGQHVLQLEVVHLHAIIEIQLDALLGQGQQGILLPLLAFA